MPRTTIHELLETARRRLERLDARAAAAAVEDGAVLIDIRSARRRELPRPSPATRRSAAASSEG